MERNNPTLIRRRVDTASGHIGYTEHGIGPVALFVHGVLLNGYLWRHQLEHLSDIRRCIAVDLLAHGDTEVAPGQDVSVTANAKMLREFLDALNIDQVDLVGNDIIESDLRPLVRTEQRTRDLERCLAAFNNQHTVAIEARLKTSRPQRSLSGQRTMCTSI